MIKAKHHWFFVRFFDGFTKRKLKSDFHHVNIVGEWNQSENATIIIGNHVSWWDGFWAMYLNKRFLNKRFHVMMLEKQLAERQLFTKAGAFSIDPGNRSVIESLNYTAKLLSNSENCVVLFPQGKINSLYQNKIGFEKGIEKILQKSPPVQLLFYVAMVDYFSEQKPELTFYLKEIEYQKYNTEEINSLYQLFYSECIENQIFKNK